MNLTAKFFILAAAAFSIWGDYYIKKYGDGRNLWDLVRCLLLWEVCAAMWAFCYRQHVSLGQSTMFGQAVVVLSNIAVGALLFSEHMRLEQWVGAAFILAGIALVGL